MHSETPVVSVIRRSSRLMVRELGFMGSTLASTNYSPSAVHTLVEIALRKEMTASQLVQLLGLEKVQRQSDAGSPDCRRRTRGGHFYRGCESKGASG